ncbi:MAG: NADase-type glycan-binding domain-containing protein [Rhodospirillales bacterium]|jgi:hypothetical protein
MKKIEIATITASSFYKSEAFGPKNLIDGDKNFGGWITDVAAWQNAWIEFRFAEPTPLLSLEICNGFIEEEIAKTRDDYFFHKRAKNMAIHLGGDHPKLVHEMLEDIKEPQILTMGIFQPIQTVRIIFTSVYGSVPDPSITPYDVLGLRHVEWHS